MLVYGVGAEVLVRGKGEGEIAVAMKLDMHITLCYSDRIFMFVTFQM